MIDAETRRAVFTLHRHGLSGRDISRRLSLSRNTVGSIIKLNGDMPQTVRRDRLEIDLDLLQRLYEQCAGRIQRVHEKLVEEEGIKIEYSTLTRMLRRLKISQAPDSRCDQVPDEPGMEMQHDTSPYKIMVGDKKVQVVASMLYLRYSKRRYLKFYRHFNRFQMKCFFHEALEYWQYGAERCIIDNTNLARLRGAGGNALITPEMEQFAKRFGFTFQCHAIGHANRKAGEERGFWTVETNFLPGRSFKSMADLNQQAFHWATERMYHRPLTLARIVSAQAFEHEKSYLVKIVPGMPAPYLSHQRLIDQYGFIAFAANFYWVPGAERGAVAVLEYDCKLVIYRDRTMLCTYVLPEDGVKNKKFSPPGLPRPRHQPSNRKKPTGEKEKRLRTISPVVSDYLDMALKPAGIERHSFVRKLFALSRRMTEALFITSIARAHKYRVMELKSIERISQLYMTQEECGRSAVEVDADYRKRESYLEGELTELPDLSCYDQEQEEGGNNG